LLGRACRPHENTIVDLEQAEQLQNFAGFGGDFIDTRKREKKKRSMEFTTDLDLRTLGYGQQSILWVVREHKSHQQFGQHASDGFPPSPCSSIP